MPFIIFFLILSILPIFPCHAQERPVTAIVYHQSELAQDGFAEQYRWNLEDPSEWERIKYHIRKMSKKPEGDVNPFLTKPKEMIVLAGKDNNSITGQDIYLTPRGIMIAEISAYNTYHKDTHDFYKFLNEEHPRRAGFEKFPGEKIPLTTKGIVARYNINKTLPNPSWLINTPEDIKLYDGFLRNLAKLSENEAYKQKEEGDFEKIGVFILHLNYDSAPAKFAVITKKSIRLSNTTPHNEFYTDEKNYFEYFQKLAADNLKTKTETDKRDINLRQKSEF